MDDSASCSLWASQSASKPFPRREESPAVAKRSLPAKLKPVGKALVVGAVVLAAEATLAWLQRRAGVRTRAAQLPPLPAARSDIHPAPPSDLIGQSLEEVFVRMRAVDRSELFVQRVVREGSRAEPPGG